MASGDGPQRGAKSKKTRGKRAKSEELDEDQKITTATTAAQPSRKRKESFSHTDQIVEQQSSKKLRSAQMGADLATTIFDIDQAFDDAEGQSEPLTTAEQTSDRIGSEKARWHNAVEAFRGTSTEQSTTASSSTPTASLTQAEIDALLLQYENDPEIKAKGREYMRQKLEADHGVKLAKNAIRNRLVWLEHENLLSATSKTLNAREAYLWDMFAKVLSPKRIVQQWNNKFGTKDDIEYLQKIYADLKTQLGGSVPPRMQLLADNKSLLETAILPFDFVPTANEQTILSMKRAGKSANDIRNELSIGRSTPVTKSQYNEMLQALLKDLKDRGTTITPDASFELGHSPEPLPKQTKSKALEIISKPKISPGKLPQTGTGASQAQIPVLPSPEIDLAQSSEVGTGSSDTSFFNRLLLNVLNGDNQLYRNTRYTKLQMKVAGDQQYYKTTFVNRASNNENDITDLPFREDIPFEPPMHVEVHVPVPDYSLEETYLILDNLKSLFDLWHGEEPTAFMVAGFQNAIVKAILPEKNLVHNKVVFQDDAYKIRMRTCLPFTGEHYHMDSAMPSILEGTVTITAFPGMFDPDGDVPVPRKGSFGGKAYGKVTLEGLGVRTSKLSKKLKSQHTLALEVLKEFVTVRDYMLISPDNLQQLWQQRIREFRLPRRSEEGKIAVKRRRVNNPARMLFNNQRLFGVKQNMWRTNVQLVPSPEVKKGFKNIKTPPITLNTTWKSLILKVVEMLETTWLDTGDLATAWKAALDLAKVMNEQLAEKEMPSKRICDCEDKETSLVNHCCDQCLDSVACRKLQRHYQGGLVCPDCFITLPTESEDLMDHAHHILRNVLQHEFRQKDLAVDKNPQFQSIYNAGCEKLEQYLEEEDDGILRCIYSKRAFSNVGTGSNQERLSTRISVDAIYPYGELAIHSPENIGPCLTFLNYMKWIWVPAILQHMADHKRNQISNNELQSRVRSLHLVTLLGAYRLSSRENDGSQDKEKNKAMWLAARIANSTPKLEQARLNYIPLSRTRKTRPAAWKFPYDDDIERILGQMESAYAEKYGEERKFRRGEIDGCVIYFDGEVPKDWNKWNCWQWICERKLRLTKSCNKYWKTIDSETTLLLHACQTWLDRGSDLGDVLFPNAPWELWLYSPLRVSFGKREPNKQMRTIFPMDQPKDLSEAQPELSNISVETWVANMAKSNFEASSFEVMSRIIAGMHIDRKYYDPDLAAVTVSIPDNARFMISGLKDALPFSMEPEISEQDIARLNGDDDEKDTGYLNDDDKEQGIEDPEESVEAPPALSTALKVEDASSQSSLSRPIWDDDIDVLSGTEVFMSGALDHPRAIRTEYTDNFEHLRNTFTADEIRAELLSLPDHKIRELFLEAMERDPDYAFRLRARRQSPVVAAQPQDEQ